MQQITIDVYSFDELDEQAKDVARNHMRNGYGPCDCDFEQTTEDAKEVMKLLGFEEASEIVWSGFGSQGDGASIEGSWWAKNCQFGKLAEHAPKDSELQNIAVDFEAFAKKYPTANVNLGRGNNRYCHEHSVTLEVIMEWEGNENVFGSETDQFKEITKPIVALMRWIYRQLEAANDYWYSQENIDGLLSHFTFTKGGLRSVSLPNN
jgi:hypothetical protein